MDKLDKFIYRLKKIGIDIKCHSNFPWLYITSINGINVKEKYNSEYGYVIAYITFKNGVVLNQNKDLFKLIRKYIGWKERFFNFFEKLFN